MTRVGERFVAFPPGRRGVLLPAGDRRTAALGISLFTASKPHVVALQRAAARAVRVLGTGCLLQRTLPWEAPLPDEDWEALSDQWRDALGPWDGVALYQRRQVERRGSTALITRAGHPLALVKVRVGVEGGRDLAREQQALAGALATRPRTFSSPEPLGTGRLGADLCWSAQSVVFSRPHGPMTAAPPGLFEEVAATLGALSGPTGSEQAPAHNDLTPWNLRRDHRGRVWLYDWEDWGPAPPDSDRTYFAATAHALCGAPLPTGLDARGVETWIRVFDTPGARPDPNAELTRSIRAALATLRRTAIDPPASAS